MTTFGQIISPHLPEQWILELSERWFLEYLAETERQHGFEPHYFPPIKSFVTANDFEGYWPEDELPCLLVMNSGIDGLPRRKGDGSYDVTWLYGCAIIVGTSTRRDTRIAMHVYAAAFTEMILNKKSLEHPEVVTGLSWVAGAPAPMPPDGDRMLGAAQMFFTVDISGVAHERGTTPSPEPRDDPYEPSGDEVVVREGEASATIQKRGEV